MTFSVSALFCYILVLTEEAQMGTTCTHTEELSEWQKHQHLIKVLLAANTECIFLVKEQLYSNFGIPKAYRCLLTSTWYEEELSLGFWPKCYLLFSSPFHAHQTSYMHAHTLTLIHHTLPHKTCCSTVCPLFSSEPCLCSCSLPLSFWTFLPLCGSDWDWHLLSKSLSTDPTLTGKRFGPRPSPHRLQYKYTY